MRARERDRLTGEVAELRRRLRRAEQERERLRRRLARLEPAQELDYLFIVTYGRSGSTLVQGILNSIPGYLIRGENRQMLRSLYDFHRTGSRVRRWQRRQLAQDREGPGETNATSAYYGMDAFPKARSLAGIRRLAVETLLRPDADTRVAGFKEIRWDDEDVADFVAWLREVFPGARFVVNTRNLEDVAQSKWWGKDPEALERLTATERRLLDLAEQLGDAAHHVRYDDYVDSPEALRPFFEWLGEPFDEQRVRDVLAVRHSF